MCDPIKNSFQASVLILQGGGGGERTLLEITGGLLIDNISPEPMKTKGKYPVVKILLEAQCQRSQVLETLCGVFIKG